MAGGWRRRGRATVTAQAEAGAQAVSARTRALAAPEELRRPALWERLSEAQRAALLAPYGGLIPAIRTEVESAPGDDAQTQAWVADFVASRFQKTAVAVIESWLRDAAPDAHLAVIGARGYGRMSLVTTLARRAMAALPPPPDYCVMPDYHDLTRAILLTLPAGKAMPFALLANTALAHIINDWSKLRSEAGRGDSGPLGSGPLGDEKGRGGPPAGPVLAPYFAPALAVAPALASATLVRIQETLEEALSAPFPPPVVEIEAPAAGMRSYEDQSLGDSAAEDGASSAPVVVCLRTPPDPNRLLLRANGGILILTADLLTEREQPSALWLALRHVLRTSKMYWRSVATPPIPLSLRVIVVGTAPQFNDVYQRADEFPRLFRYEAPFETDTPWEREGAGAGEAEATYAAFAAGVARRYGLPPLDASAVAALVEEGARRVGGRNRGRLTTELTLPHDLVIEAGRQAQSGASGSVNSATITRAHIEGVLAERREWQGIPARALRESILLGRELVPTAGAAIGEINGLSVFPMVPEEGTFGAPMRISATVSPGRERLIDIERESSGADRSHISGALTLAGYLAYRYGRERPLSLVARTRFEQLHGRTGGDSASAGLLLAILSALAEAPIYNARAVTGAVGQHGEMQAIGGANDKVEGFWEICRQRRMAGEQPEVPYGMLLPVANAQDLMLRRDVAGSIATEGWFHLWPVATIDEALPLLAGLTAEEFHARVDRRLQRFFELAAASTPGR